MGLTEESAGYQIAALKEILDHQRQSVLGSEQIKANVVSAQQAVTEKNPGNQP